MMSNGGPHNAEQALVRLHLLLQTASNANGDVCNDEKKYPKALYEQDLKQKAMQRNDKNRSAEKPRNFGKRDTPIHKGSGNKM